MIAGIRWGPGGRPLSTAVFVTCFTPHMQSEGFSPCVNIQGCSYHQHRQQQQQPACLKHCLGGGRWIWETLHPSFSNISFNIAERESGSRSSRRKQNISLFTCTMTREMTQVGLAGINKSPKYRKAVVGNWPGQREAIGQLDTSSWRKNTLHSYRCCHQRKYLSPIKSVI